MIRPWERFSQNPVVLKELRSRMRGSRAFILLTVYLGALGLLVGLVYLVFLSSADSQFGSASDRQVMGKVIFGIVFGLEILAMCFIAPALTAGAISAERERQTYDILRTTLLPARSLVLGKFFSALAFLLLLLFTALPLLSLAFFFGGVAIEEFLIGTVIAVITAVTFCSVGMLFSSFMARTLASTVLAYAFAILLVFGLPFLVLTFSGLVNYAFSGAGSPASLTTQVFLVIGGWLLVSFNPLMTAIATEAILIEQQNPWIFTLPVSSQLTVSLPSPWIVYCVLYLALSLLLLGVSIRFVRRPEK